MSVTAAQGFRAAGVAAGLKSGGRRDVAVVVNDGPRDGAAAVYTANRCKAHPVLWSEQASRDGRLRAVVLNSGGANCYTGAAGFQAVHDSAEQVGAALAASAGDVVVCSTGLIGQPLDGPLLTAGIATALDSLSTHGGDDAAEAIITTDSHAKQAIVQRDGWTIGGMAKGAGMLAPSLATMLVVLTTDADLTSAECDTALRSATRVTFDRLDSDGCMSTNDTVVLMASGASGVVPEPATFADALRQLCHGLAMQLLHDAEGSRHDVTIDVVGAASEDDAVEVGRAVARSNLLKCAIFGEDANWGRVLASVGTTSAEFDPSTVDVAFQGTRVCIAGGPGESRDLVRFDGRAVSIVIDLHAGEAAATIWTNDLTTEYVHENSAYSS